uniref:C-type lectin domain-containing protein n=1 Tax=Anabas testudineus TaxID=64144 RepID=A0A3Q1JUY6_ANATE
MPVAADSMSGEAGRDSWNLMANDKSFQCGWQSASPVLWIGAAALCLGLLLMTVILGVVAHSKYIHVGLMKYENLIKNLTKDRDTLREQQDHQYNTVAASRDKLQEELKSRTDKLCYQGWVKFNDKCYFASENGRRAKLVIISTKDELNFVAKLYSKAWIGLFDTQEEGKWKWVDGTHLIGSGS